MNLKDIQVTLAQLTPKLSEKQHNLLLIREAIAKASKEKSDIIIFPELFLTGYSVGENISDLAEVTNGPSLTEIKKLCRKHSIFAVVGFPEKGDDGNYYISSAFINEKGGLQGVYRKVHLFDSEKKYFSQGTEIPVFDTPLGKIGLMICFDVEFPEVARALKLKGADLIIISNANMVPYEVHHHIYAKSRAMENEIPVIICNRLGSEGELNFCGDSMVINSDGKVLLSMGNKEGVKTIGLPLHSSTDPKLGYIAKRRRELYSV
ncbi:carbon-nitrogen hydrolase family protein [Siminovitchia terrae]|uniref:carbon-nitrogen hydrolase family protein n=1 Tax=Siminovitchia terrae TaxID=1914933 RepID=UPI00163BD8FC|nr:carbon-nitrogen hydrolase family protein [Siminovitchia terrae]